MAATGTSDGERLVSSSFFLWRAVGVDPQLDLQRRSVFLLRTC